MQEKLEKLFYYVNLCSYKPGETIQRGEVRFNIHLKFGHWFPFETGAAPKQFMRKINTKLNLVEPKTKYKGSKQRGHKRNCV